MRLRVLEASVVRAPPKRVRRVLFLLTKTYMDVGNTSTTAKSRIRFDANAIIPG